MAHFVIIFEVFQKYGLEWLEDYCSPLERALMEGGDFLELGKVLAHQRRRWNGINCRSGRVNSIWRPPPGLLVSWKKGSKENNLPNENSPLSVLLKLLLFQDRHDTMVSIDSGGYSWKETAD